MTRQADGGGVEGSVELGERPGGVRARGEQAPSRGGAIAPRARRRTDSALEVAQRPAVDEVGKEAESLADGSADATELGLLGRAPAQVEAAPHVARQTTEEEDLGGRRGDRPEQSL